MGKKDVKKEGLSSSNGGNALIPQKLVGMENKKMKKKVVKKGVGTTIAATVAPVAAEVIANKLMSGKTKKSVAKSKREQNVYLDFLESDEIQSRLRKAKAKDTPELKDAMDIIKSNVKVVKKSKKKVAKSQVIAELMSVTKAEEGSKKMIFGHPFTLKGGKWIPDEGGIPDHKVSKPKDATTPKGGKPTSTGKNHKAVATPKGGKKKSTPSKPVEIPKETSTPEEGADLPKNQINPKWEIDHDGNSTYITNTKGHTVGFERLKSGKLIGHVEGYKGDISLGEVNPKNIKEIVSGINNKWIRENDPYGDRW